MYESPKLERFGSFRELTQGGIYFKNFDATHICGEAEVPDEGGPNNRS